MISRTGLPFQPGEASWASWKCDGGPHLSDFEPPRAKEVHKSNLRAPLTRSVMIFDLSDAAPPQQYEVEIGIPDERMTNMIP